MKPYWEREGVSVYCCAVEQWCAEYAGEPAHALLSDPPYHLTPCRADGPAQYMKQREMDRQGAGGFMGMLWDGGDVAFRPETWATLAEHLLPGAFGFAFCGSRGWHRQAVAIEDAGFVFHPSVFMLGWINGQSFPKSARIDTQIDRAAGAEREVVGVNPNARPNSGRTGGIMGQAVGRVFNTEVTAPATELAKTWAGHRYGRQMLKGAVEPVLCFQRPYGGRPVDSITEHGSGALWIDGSRVSAMPSGSQLGDGACKRPPWPELRDPSVARDHAGGATPDCDPDRRLSSPVSLRDERLCMLGPSPSQLGDWLGSIASVLRSGGTDDTGLSRNVGDQGDIAPMAVARDCQPLARLYPNGVWCGLNLIAVRDSLGDCPSCRHSGDALLRSVEEAALAGAPSLADALERIASDQPSPSHTRWYECTDHPSSGYHALVSALACLLAAYIGVPIIPCLAPPRQPQGRWPSNVCLVHSLLVAWSGTRPTGARCGCVRSAGRVWRQPARPSAGHSRRPRRSSHRCSMERGRYDAQPDTCRRARIAGAASPAGTHTGWQSVRAAELRAGYRRRLPTLSAHHRRHE